VRVSEETDIELLRKKADVLESENERLSNKVSQLLRENLALKGMAPEQVALNLPGLLERVTEPSKSSGLTKPGSERRANHEKPEKEKNPQRGHGPTDQPKAEVQKKLFDVDEADMVCPICGDALEDWEGHEDETEVIDVVERKWVVVQATLKKGRCPRGCHVETAIGPERMIPGGRYTPNVAITAATDKYLDQLPLERQMKRARRQAVNLTTQALWDQVWALALLLLPLVGRIKEFILTQAVLGVDESPFKLIKKGGSVKWQAWQLSCPLAVYFEILPAKSAEMGRELLGDYAGEVVVDGAATYEALARAGPFNLSNCWSHGRRQVLKAEGEAPGQVAEFLDLVGELYAIEREAVTEGRADDQRRGYRHRVDIEKLAALRDTKSREVIGRLKTWIQEQRCIPGGQLKASLTYIAKRWTALTRFLDNPLIPLDNNDTEAGYVWVAIGRRNYLGARSKRGMKAAATFYTIFESARAVGADPEAYLRYATELLRRGETPLLPHGWVSQPSQEPQTADTPPQ
jgi:transposase